MVICFLLIVNLIAFYVIFTNCNMATGRNWIFTVNNYTDNDEQVVQEVDCRYMLYGREIAPTTGTPHLQGFVCFDTNRRLAGCKKLFPPGTHFEIMRGRVIDNQLYCSKAGDVFTKGEPPDNSMSSLKGEAYWTFIRNKLEEKSFDELPNSYTEGRRELYKKRRMEINSKELKTIDGELDNYWIYGKAGVGKSKYVREKYGDSLYIKRETKWWDGYENEDTVLIEDLDPTDFAMLKPLKLYGDRYPFVAESKGSSTLIRPKRIIITSNYKMEQVFQNLSEEEMEPLKRRFKIMEFV